VWRKIRAPSDIAPRANAFVNPVGSTWPSVGRNAAARTPPGSITGNSSTARSGETSSNGTPTELAIPATWWNWCRRSSVVAIRSEPQRW
jgi:hypothetical protein